MAGLPYRLILATDLSAEHLALAPPNVDVRQSMSPEEGRALMRHAAVVAVTFEDTDLACGPTIILDAISMGIPVVANDTNACRDYIHHGINGYLSRPGDIAGLAENIVSLMERPILRKDMGHQARMLADSDLSR